MRKSAIFMIGMVFMTVFSIPAYATNAWDDLVFLTGMAYIGETGRITGSAGFKYSSAGDWYDANGDKQDLADSETELRIPFVGTFTPVRNVQAFAIVPIVNFDDGTDSNSGIGDIWLGAKYAVLPQGMLTIRGALDLPTGDDKKTLGDEGGFGFDIAALTQKPMDSFMVGGQVGVRVNAEDGDTKLKPGVGIYANGYVDYAFTPRIPGWFRLTYFSRGDGEYDGMELADSNVNWMVLDVGGAVAITDMVQAGADIAYTLAGTNALTDVAFGLFVSYSMVK